MNEHLTEDGTNNLNTQLNLGINNITSRLPEVLTEDFANRIGRKPDTSKNANRFVILDDASSANNGRHIEVPGHFALRTRPPSSDSGGIREHESRFNALLRMIRFHNHQGQLSADGLGTLTHVTRRLRCRQLPWGHPMNRNRRRKRQLHYRFPDRCNNNICVVHRFWGDSLSVQQIEHTHQRNANVIASQMEGSLNISNSRNPEQSSIDLADQIHSSPTGIDFLSSSERSDLLHNIENIGNDFKRTNIDQTDKSVFDIYKAFTL